MIPPSSCAHRYAATCCVDCGEKDCVHRCKNHPDTCRLWTEGPPRKKRGDRKGERKIDARRAALLYGQGLTQAEVAKRLGCCKKTVGAVLREMGVKRNGNA